jgi:hypothetical protein
VETDAMAEKASERKFDFLAAAGIVAVVCGIMVVITLFSM